MPMTELKLNAIEGGGVASACGFKAGGIHAGFRDDPESFRYGSYRG